MYKHCRTVILLFLYGSQSLTFREEHRLMVINNTVPKKCGPKEDKITVDQRRMHNEELHDMHSSPTIILMIK
jgi:hypothetical protein